MRVAKTKREGGVFVLIHPRSTFLPNLREEDNDDEEEDEVRLD
jgi:hypothetical protein